MSLAVGTLLQGPWSAAKGEALAFVKLHDSMLASSVWGLPDSVRIVWITMLMMCDANGVVQASESGLARMAKVTIRKARFALEVLAAPDPESRDGTTGERIEKVPGGWLVLNYGEYRDKQTTQQLKTAARVARHRAKVKEGRNVTERYVTGCNAPSPAISLEGEADGEGEGDSDTRRRRDVPSGTGDGPADGDPGRTLAPEAETVRRIFGGTAQDDPGCTNWRVSGSGEHRGEIAQRRGRRAAQ